MAHVHKDRCYNEIFGLDCREWHKEVAEARKELQQCIELLGAEESNANLVLAKLQKIKEVMEHV